MKKNDKGQVTIFIIIALIIVVAVVLAFVLIKKPGQKISVEENPKEYVERCVSESLKKIEQTMFSDNLYPNPQDNYILYDGKKIKYLCKSARFYVPCINQEPMLVGYVQKNIENKIKTNVEDCFSDMRKALDSRDYDITETKLNISVEFTKEFISVYMDKKVTFTKAAESKTITGFSSRIDSPLYNLIDTMRNIINYESTTCQFNSISWMKNFPDIQIRKFVASDQTKIYSVLDKDTEKELVFAVKTCVLPAGI